MELFGHYFPEEIINWCCDDWINLVYQNIGRFYPLTAHFCINIGGDPRYEINNDAKFRLSFRKSVENLRKTTAKMAENDAKKITEKLKLILQ